MSEDKQVEMPERVWMVPENSDGSIWPKSVWPESFPAASVPYVRTDLSAPAVPDDLISKQQLIQWLNRCCDFGPPCGKCIYCSVALNVKRMNLPAAPAVEVGTPKICPTCKNEFKPDDQGSCRSCDAIGRCYLGNR